MIPFFQNNPIPWSNMFPYPFCSFWNWIINDFSSISHYHDQMIVHQIYWMRIMIYFSFSTDSIRPWIALLNKCSLFIFTQFISHLQRKENSCYIMLKFLFCVVFVCFLMIFLLHQVKFLRLYVKYIWHRNFCVLYINHTKECHKMVSYSFTTYQLLWASFRISILFFNLLMQKFKEVLLCHFHY